MGKRISELHEAANKRLWGMLPQDQRDRVFSADMCDIDESYLGFIGIYEALASIIPSDWTVLDLGCAYAPQSFLFAGHAAYIGVDMLTPLSSRFAPSNAVHHHMSIAEFIDTEADRLAKESTFAICSYVPPWQSDNMALTRGAFEKVFTFYPHGDKPTLVPRSGVAA